MVNPENLNNFAGTFLIKIHTPLALYPQVKMWVSPGETLHAKRLQTLLRDLLNETGFTDYLVHFVSTPREDGVSFADGQTLARAQRDGLAISLTSPETRYTFYPDMLYADGGARTRSRSRSRSRRSGTGRSGTRRRARKSPAESATLYSVGRKKRGLDGTLWAVAVTSNGVRRWTRHR
jgi:hypothetical protein